MNILYVTPTFYPAVYWGGPIHSVYGLCNAMVKNPGVLLRVLTTDAAGPMPSDSVAVTGFPMIYPGGYEVYFCRRRWSADISPGLFLRLWSMIRWADVVHLTSVYSPPTIPTLLVCRVLNKPIVWSPRGALQRWEGTTRPLLKRIWERICNALIDPRKCLLHVTSSEEAIDSKMRIPKAIVESIPNGVDCPESLPDRDWKPDGTLRLLFIGRLHVKKGIENLLRALRELDDVTILLVICGSGDESYLRGLQQLVYELGLDQRVSFRGHVDGEEKRKVFMHTDVCIVPSFTENFGMVVAESLAHGVPVIASQGTPWLEVERRGCGFWIENKPDVLAEAIRRIRTMDLAMMGKNGRDWMFSSFGWDAVALRLLNAYKRLVGGRG